MCACVSLYAPSLSVMVIKLPSLPVTWWAGTWQFPGPSCTSSLVCPCHVAGSISPPHTSFQGLAHPWVCCVWCARRIRRSLSGTHVGCLAAMVRSVWHVHWPSGVASRGCGSLAVGGARGPCCPACCLSAFCLLLTWNSVSSHFLDWHTFQGFR